MQELLDKIAAHVHNRLGGRINDFIVRLLEEGLVLRGCTFTYYEKQLAQHCVMSMTDLPIYANEIKVVASVFPGSQEGPSPHDSQM
jgi:hypothetical protein